MIQPIHDLAQDLSALNDLCDQAEAIIARIRIRAQSESVGQIRTTGFTDIEIYCQVCDSMALKPEEIRKQCRTKDAVRDRSAVVERLAELGWGSSRIGRMIQRDHGSVSNLLKKHNPHPARIRDGK